MVGLKPTNKHQKWSQIFLLQFTPGDLLITEIHHVSFNSIWVCLHVIMVLCEACNLRLINSFFNSPTLHILPSEMSALATGKNVWIFPKKTKHVLLRWWWWLLYMVVVFVALVYAENSVTLIYIFAIYEARDFQHSLSQRE